MKDVPSHPNKLPYKSRVLVTSLACATLLLLIIYFLHHAGLLGSKLAIWAAIGVFVAAAIYEIFLFSLVTRHMMKHLGEPPEKK